MKEKSENSEIGNRRKEKEGKSRKQTVRFCLLESTSHIGNKHKNIKHLRKHYQILLLKADMIHSFILYLFLTEFYSISIHYTLNYILNYPLDITLLIILFLFLHSPSI